MEHPFMPKDIVLDGYQDVLLSVPQILGVFFSAVGGLLFLSWLGSAHLALGQRLQVTWFVVTGLIHTAVEGTYVIHDRFFQNTDPNMFLLELWKEYSKADSRYATRDSFVLSVEVCTAFVMGPLCFLAVVGLLTRASWRFGLIIVVSVCQFYGTVFYFMTCYFEDWVHSRPEFLYFWFMFVIVNGVWLVVPGLCTWDALCKVNRAVKAAGMDMSKKVV
jgi:cholestenol Delta-isomerase